MTQPRDNSGRFITTVNKETSSPPLQVREQSQTGQVDMNSRSESSSDTHPTGGDMPAEMTAFDALAKELIETMRSKLKALLLLKHFEGDDGQYGATISPKWVTNVQSTLGSKVRAADQSLRAIDSIHSVLIPSINMYIEDTISTSADLVEQLRKSYPANNDAENKVLATEVAELDEDMLEGLHRTLSDFKSTELTNEIQSRSRAAYKQESRYSSLFAAISALTVYDTEPYITLRIAANMGATMQSDPESTQELDTAPGERAIQEIKKLTEKNPGGPLSELTGAALRTEQNREILNSLCIENALKIPAPHIEKCNSVKLI